MSNKAIKQKEFHFLPHELIFTLTRLDNFCRAAAVTFFLVDLFDSFDSFRPRNGCRAIGHHPDTILLFRTLVRQCI